MTEPRKGLLGPRHWHREAGIDPTRVCAIDGQGWPCENELERRHPRKSPSPDRAGLCEARIYERDGVNWHRCDRRAVGERQGRASCSRHLRTKYAPYWVKDEAIRGAG